MTQPNQIPSQPYGSARDLPTFVELEQQMAALGMLTKFIARKQHEDIKTLRKQLDRMVDTVDRFYAAVGQRNWVFHDLFNSDDIAELLAAADSADEVEQGLIEIYRNEEKVRYWLLKLCNQPLLRERAHQIRRAYDHLQADQFDSCVLQLVAVMDGYVSDLDAGNRKGLHARDADDVQAWDSVVGHHLGLTHALKMFLKPIKKRIDDPVYEVHRHGIVHGMVVNFDNPIVACKAWNMLFALNDWAVSLEKAAKPPEPKPTLREFGTTLVRHGRYRRAQQEFVASTHRAGEAGFEELEIVAAARSFLDSWQHGRWQPVASFMPSVLRGNYTDGQAAKFAKDCFEQFDLSEFELIECSLDGPSAAGLVARVVCNGEDDTIRFRMGYWTDDGNVGLPSDGNGSWRVAVWAPRKFFDSLNE